MGNRNRHVDSSPQQAEAFKSFNLFKSFKQYRNQDAIKYRHFFKMFSFKKSPELRQRILANDVH